MAAPPGPCQPLLAQLDSVLSQVRDQSGAHVLDQFCPHPFRPHTHATILSAAAIAVQQGAGDVSVYADRLGRCAASITFSPRIEDLASHANRLAEKILVADDGDGRTREASAAADALLAALESGAKFSMAGLTGLFVNVTEKVTALFNVLDMISTHSLKQSIAECSQCLDDIQFALDYHRQLTGLAEELRVCRSEPPELFTKKAPRFGIEWAEGSGQLIPDDSEAVFVLPDDDEALSLEHLEPYFAVRDRRATLDDLRARLRGAPSDPAEVSRLLDQRERLLSELSSLRASDS
jgi:hypothetical protein